MASRRKFITAFGTLAVGTLAGCSGDGEDTETPADTLPTNQTAKLSAGDSKDDFGDSVAVSGDGSTALVGAQDDEDPNGEDAGSAYVFE